MVCVGAFVDFERSLDIVIVASHARGELGFLLGIVADFMGITNPAALGLVSLTHI